MEYRIKFETFFVRYQFLWWVIEMRSKKPMDTRLLIALDDSDASRRAVKYVGQIVGRRRGYRICLVHVLQPLPPALLEHGGSEDPAKEACLQRELKAEQRRWISTAKDSSQKSLDRARAALRKAGLSTRAVETTFCEPGDGPDTADNILKSAEKYRCHTIVVGRRSASWFHELFSQELWEELIRRGKGYCVWVIE